MAKVIRPVEDQNKPVEQAAKAPEKPKLAPLTKDEQAEMADLEKRARNGRSQLQPTPHEMMRLGKLRERAKANC